MAARQINHDKMALGLAYICMRLGRTEESLGLYDRAIAGRREIYGQRRSTMLPLKLELGGPFGELWPVAAVDWSAGQGDARDSRVACSLGGVCRRSSKGGLQAAAFDGVVSDGDAAGFAGRVGGGGQSAGALSCAVLRNWWMYQAMRKIRSI
ncbi:MAG UNVERIFIED_CONTAM: hypothetical protein LVR18_49890 [Planctomycetaceae bacterium]|jgi:hypothetical protein